MILSIYKQYLATNYSAIVQKDYDHPQMKHYPFLFYYHTLLISVSNLRRGSKNETGNYVKYSHLEKFNIFN